MKMLPGRRRAGLRGGGCSCNAFHVRLGSAGENSRRLRVRADWKAADALRQHVRGGFSLWREAQILSRELHLLGNTKGGAGFKVNITGWCWFTEALGFIKPQSSADGPNDDLLNTIKRIMSL